MPTTAQAVVLRQWTVTPPECNYAKDRYTAPHCLRYLDGYFCNFFLASLPGIQPSTLPFDIRQRLHTQLECRGLQCLENLLRNEFINLLGTQSDSGFLRASQEMAFADIMWHVDIKRDVHLPVTCATYQHSGQ